MAQSAEERKRSLRFTLATDLVLLREVGRHRPWASPHGKIRDTWEQIANAVTAAINDERDSGEPPARVDHGASKRRYDVLMEAFAKDELKSMRAKGSPDLYMQREELLAELSLQVRPCLRSQLGELLQLTRGWAQLSQFQENKMKVKRPSQASDGSAPSTSAFVGVKHPRVDSIDSFADMKRQVLAPVTLSMAAPAAPRISLEAAAPAAADACSLRVRELELAEKRLELDRARYESEREERGAILSSMQATTALLLRVVERLDQAAVTANAINGAGMAASFINRQQL